MTDATTIRYRAFLSYSHGDARWANWLHSRLEGFRIDKDLVSRETRFGFVPAELRPIFRDREDFVGGHSLTDATIAALDASAALLVLCSPVSAGRPAVNEEVRLFRSRHPDRPVIPVIVEGTWPENFPPALRYEVAPDGSVTARPLTILGPDLREMGDGRRLGLAKIVAGLTGLDVDEIFRRAERRQRRQFRWRAAAAAVIAVLAVAVVAPPIFASYVRKTALECDLYAAEMDNDVHVTGVLLKQIIPDIAIPACSRAVQVDPANPRLLNNLGRAYESAGRFAEAATWYQKAVDLKWAAAENNLAGLYFYGRGVPLDFARAIALIRTAAAQNNDDAVHNYTRTPMDALFRENDTLAAILEKALARKGMIARDNVAGRWSEQIGPAIEAFKTSEHISDEAITVRVLDRLGVVPELSAAITEARPAKHPGS